MQFIIPTYAELQLRGEITIKHHEREVVWDISAFSRGGFDKDPDLFKCINDYLRQIPENDQRQLFELFERARGVLDICVDIETIDIGLMSVIRQMYEIVTFDQMYLWVHFHSGIRIPNGPDLPAVYKESASKTYTRNKTYTQEDYRKLISVIVQLRLMAPIWAEYIDRVGAVVGTNFKEMYAYYLLQNSTVWNNEGMEKLRTYVNEYIPASGNESAIVEFVNSEEYPNWIFGLLVVRRLSLQTVISDPNDNTAVIVRHVSRHVRERVNRTENSFGGKILPKKVRDEAGMDDSSNSMLEDYKIQQEFSPGKSEFICYQVRDPWQVATQIAPTLPREIFDVFMQSLEVLQKHPVQDSQVLLLKWIIDPVVPAEGVEFLAKYDLQRTMCATAAVMWHEGFHLLAGLLCAIVTRTSNDEVVSSGTESRGRLTKETAEKLDELFPYKRKKGAKSINPVEDDIGTMVDLFTRNAWTLTLPPEYVAQVNQRTPNSPRLTLPHTFKTKIAEFVIHVAERDYNDNPLTPHTTAVPATTLL